LNFDVVIVIDIAISLPRLKRGALPRAEIIPNEPRTGNAV